MSDFYTNFYNTKNKKPLNLKPQSYDEKAKNINAIFEFISQFKNKKSEQDLLDEKRDLLDVIQEVLELNDKNIEQISEMIDINQQITAEKITEILGSEKTYTNLFNNEYSGIELYSDPQNIQEQEKNITRIARFLLNTKGLIEHNVIPHITAEVLNIDSFYVEQLYNFDFQNQDISDMPSAMQAIEELLKKIELEKRIEKIINTTIEHFKISKGDEGFDVKSSMEIFAKHISEKLKINKNILINLESYQDLANQIQKGEPPNFKSEPIIAKIFKDKVKLEEGIRRMINTTIEHFKFFKNHEGFDVKSNMKTFAKHISEKLKIDKNILINLESYQELANQIQEGKTPNFKVERIIANIFKDKVELYAMKAFKETVEKNLDVTIFENAFNTLIETIGIDKNIKHTDDYNEIKKLVEANTDNKNRDVALIVQEIFNKLYTILVEYGRGWFGNIMLVNNINKNCIGEKTEKLIKETETLIKKPKDQWRNKISAEQKQQARSFTHHQ